MSSLLLQPPLHERDLNDLYYFAAVVQAGGFSAAGRLLGMSKSHLSRRVATLESRLGVRLMQRSTRRLHLTQAGERYYGFCKAIAETATAADEAMLDLLAEPTGVVTMSCPVSLMQIFMPRLIPNFLASHPKVSVRLQMARHGQDPMPEGVDISVRIGPTMEADGHLVARRLGSSLLNLVAHRDYLERRGLPRTPDDLHQHDIISYESDTGQYQWPLTDAEGHTSMVAVAPRLICGDFNTLIASVLYGQGIALLPNPLWTAQDVDGVLRTVLPDWRVPEGILYCVYPTRRGMIPAVRVLIDHLMERIPQLLSDPDALGHTPALICSAAMTRPAP